MQGQLGRMLQKCNEQVRRCLSRSILKNTWVLLILSLIQKKAFLIRSSENEIFPMMGRSVTIWSKTKRSPWLLRERNMLQRCAWVSLEVLQRCASSFLKCHKTGEMGGSWLIRTHSEQFTCDQRFHYRQQHRPLYEYCKVTFFIASDEILIGNTSEKLRYMQLPNFASENLKFVAYLPKQTARDAIIS